VKKGRKKVSALKSLLLKADVLLTTMTGKFKKADKLRTGEPIESLQMFQSNTVKIKDIGPVLFEPSTKAKHLNISVRPFKGVRVAVPKGVSLKKAEQFLHSKAKWIQKHMAKMNQLEKVHEDVSDKLVRIDPKEAKKILVARLNELTEKHGFTYNRVFIRKQKTRWGSCSAKNNISLNVKLLLLPEKLMNFIILHELVHTRVKNHSKDFWAELLKIEQAGKALASKVKENSIGLL
jgi:predicted metal-dependent hydrolase